MNMRFDLDRLDPLTPLAQSKTAADLEWQSWVDELLFRRASDWLMATIALYLGVRYRYWDIEGAAEQRDAASAMDEVLRLHHGEWNPQTRAVYYGKAGEPRRCLTCFYNSCDTLAASEACRTCNITRPNWAPAREMQRIPRDAHIGVVDGDLRWVGVDVGKPGGDATVISVWCRQNGKRSLLAQMIEARGSAPRWEPIEPLPANTQIEYSRDPFKPKPAVRRDCDTCTHFTLKGGCVCGPNHANWEPK